LESPSTRNLLRRLIVFSVFGQLTVLALLMVPGGVHYWQGWSFTGVNLVASLIFTTYYYRRDPELLARRMLFKESIRTQKIIMFVLRQVAWLFYLFCGLDHRFGWSQHWLGPVPWWLSVLALPGYVICFFLFVPVLNANRFAASIIQTESGQVVADTGPYRIVRHPMYSVSLAIWFWIPLALGSWLALPAILLLLGLLVWRLLDEEKMLRRELPGYAEYCQRTPWRLVPFVW
jgi:protein-S-isoprenylcysteine O-methyltransferase Ste14